MTTWASAARIRLATYLLALGALAPSACGPRSAPPKDGGPAPVAMRRISRAALEDKIRGGWAAQMIGVSYGAPTEFKFRGVLNDAVLSWRPEQIEEALRQDDLYVDMTFAAVMDHVGLDATTRDYGEAFKKSEYKLWHANAGARRLLNMGVEAPHSSDPTLNAHVNDIDFQIESDFIGLMTPGLPGTANTYCERVGRVMSYGDGLYGGMFVTGMYAAAFFESDVVRIVEAGLRSIPAESAYARSVRAALSAWRKSPNDWRQAWRELNAQVDVDDQCPEGALRDFNIDARLNGAYAAMGLLYGGGDFARTMEVTSRFGQDSDCNPATAAGILGVVLGYAKIPSVYTAALPALSHRKFDFTEYSFDEITRSTLTRALAVISRAGGRVDGDTIVIPVQDVVPPRLEQWSMGTPLARYPNTEAAWHFEGEWTNAGTVEDQWVGVPLHRESHGAGNTATLTFEGTAVALTGMHGQDGGRASVRLDGKDVGVIDAYAPERTNDMALWHTAGLSDGRHELRISTRDDHDARSRGNVFRITLAVSYRAAAR